MKSVHIKNIFNKLIAVLFAGAITTVISCGGDSNPDPTPDPMSNPTSIEFNRSALTIKENATESVTLNVSFAEAATLSGSFSIAITSTDASYGTDYTSSPDGTTGLIDYSVAEGERNLTMSINAVDNNNFTGDKTVMFTLTSPENVEIGTNSTVTLTIIENEIRASDLFFSEYVEGEGNNKYLEIFNGTGESVDLSDYEVRRFNNGGTDALGSTYPLSGDLADGEVIVIANRLGTIYTGTTYNATDVNGATFFNGDDVLILHKVSLDMDVDIFGQLGCDPGSGWADGNHSTSNKTLRRKSSVFEGITVNPTSSCSETSFDTLTTEWDVFDQNAVDGLGSHMIDSSLD